MPSASARLISTERERAIRAIKFLLFSASIVPGIVGGALAYSAGVFALQPFLLAVLGLFLGQMAGDYFYYYFTRFHTDQRDAHTQIFAGWRPLFTGTLLQPRQTARAGVACLALDLLIAVYFVGLRGPPVLLFALAGGSIALFFTPLMLRGFKEPVVFVTFGPLCVTGAAFALTGSLLASAWAASLPVGCFVTVVAYLKSARFELAGEDGDPVVLKLNPARVRWLFLLGYASVLAGCAFGVLPFGSLMALLSLPLALAVLSCLSRSRSRVSDYLWATVHSILVLLATGLGIAAGYML